MFLGHMHLTCPTPPQIFPAKLMKLRLGFRMEPRSRRLSSWTDLQWFQSKDPLDRPAITTDCGANISKGVEQHGLWDWSRCICHIIHNLVNAGLREIHDTLQVLKRLSTWMHRSSNAWRAFCQVQRSVHREGRDIRRRTACISADESPDPGSLRRMEQSQKHPWTYVQDCPGNALDFEYYIW